MNWLKEILEDARRAKQQWPLWAGGDPRWHAMLARFRTLSNQEIRHILANRQRMSFAMGIAMRLQEDSLPVPGSFYRESRWRDLTYPCEFILKERGLTSGPPHAKLSLMTTTIIEKLRSADVYFDTELREKAAAELEALQGEVATLNQNLECTGRVVLARDSTVEALQKERNEYRGYLYGCDKHKLWQGMSCIGCMEQERDSLREALSVAINTVECNSLDKDGNELPWYRMAKQALAQSQRKRNL